MLRTIGLAPSEVAAAPAVTQFEASAFGQQRLEVGALWRRHCDRLTTDLAYPVPIRCMLYSTIAIESLHRPLRKSLEARGHFPSADAAAKLLYLTVRHAASPSSSPPGTVGWRSNVFACASAIACPGVNDPQLIHNETDTPIEAARRGEARGIVPLPIRTAPSDRYALPDSIRSRPLGNLARRPESIAFPAENLSHPRQVRRISRPALPSRTVSAATA